MGCGRLATGLGRDCVDAWTYHPWRPDMRYHKGSDGWGRDSYEIPQYAVVGCSDTVRFSDSPANSDLATEELEAFRQALLQESGIASRLGKPTTTGNVFCVKRWVVVHKAKFAEAAAYAPEVPEVTPERDAANPRSRPE